MSYSVCLKCKEMVGSYDKYCQECQNLFGLPDLPYFQKNNYPAYGEFKGWAKKELKKDLKLLKK